MPYELSATKSVNADTAPPDPNLSDRDIGSVTIPCDGNSGPNPKELLKAALTSLDSAIGAVGQGLSNLFKPGFKNLQGYADFIANHFPGGPRAFQAAGVVAEQVGTEVRNDPDVQLVGKVAAAVPFMTGHPAFLGVKPPILPRTPELAPVTPQPVPGPPLEGSISTKVPSAPAPPLEPIPPAFEGTPIPTPSAARPLIKQPSRVATPKEQKSFDRLVDKAKKAAEGPLYPGKDFTPAQKAKIIKENMKRNGGKVISDDPSDPYQILIKPLKNKKAVTPPPNEWQIDHIVSKDKGGTNDLANARVISRHLNREKWNK